MAYLLTGNQSDAEDLPEVEIADVLGVSVGTVKSTVSRAVAKLRHDDELRADFGGLVPAE